MQIHSVGPFSFYATSHAQVSHFEISTIYLDYKMFNATVVPLKGNHFVISTSPLKQLFKVPMAMLWKGSSSIQATTFFRINICLSTTEFEEQCCLLTFNTDRKQLVFLGLHIDTLTKRPKLCIWHIQKPFPFRNY